MRYRTLTVALLVVAAVLVVGTAIGTADHDERFASDETWTLEIEHLGGPGTTCLYDEGEHVNRVEVSDGVLSNVSIYETGEDPVQIDFPVTDIDVVLWSDGSNDAVDQLASEDGTCVANDIEQVVLKVYLFHSTLTADEGVEVLTGDAVGEAPPAGTGSVGAGVGDEADESLVDTDADPDDPTEGVDDATDDAENVTDEVDDVTDDVENVTDEVDDVTDEVDDETDDDSSGALDTIRDTVEGAVDTVSDVVNGTSDGTDDDETDGDEDTTGLSTGSVVLFQVR